FVTSAYTSQIAYAGVRNPKFGFFVVDAGGPPRVMVGPVAKPFIFSGPLEKRLTDADVPKVAGLSPWSAAYELPATPVPPLEIKAAGEYPSYGSMSDKGKLTLLVHSTKKLGKVTIELLDHHREVLAKKTEEVSEKPVK